MKVSTKCGFTYPHQILKDYFLSRRNRRTKFDTLNNPAILAAAAAAAAAGAAGIASVAVDDRSPPWQGTTGDVGVAADADAAAFPCLPI